MNNTTLLEQSLDSSFSYDEYRSRVSHLLQEGLATGNTQSEDLTHYTTLNEVRMNRLDKTIRVPEDIQNRIAALQKEFILLVISEGWCGDAAQIVPVINKIAAASDKLELRIVLRDENDGLMNEYLTNGTRSIPKLIIMDKETLSPLASWGPRPMGAVNLVEDFKAKFGKMTPEGKAELQKWYLQDKGISTMEEITKLLKAM